MTTAEKLIASGIEKGRIEGGRKGKIEGKLEAARNMILEGIGLDKVLKITGLSLDDLKKAGIVE